MIARGYGILARYYALLFPLGAKQEAFFARLTGREEGSPPLAGEETGTRSRMLRMRVMPPFFPRKFRGHATSKGPRNSLGGGGIGPVLDVGCGTGEQLAWFSAHGIPSEGMEPDEAMFLELSRRPWPGLAPSIERAGMESLPGGHAGRHGLVLCLGNTLSHLPDAAAARAALAGMRASLAPGGRLALQTVNFDRALAEGRAEFPVMEREIKPTEGRNGYTIPDASHTGHVPVFPSEIGRIRFFREYDLAAIPGRILFRTRLETPDGVEEGAWPLVPVRRDDLAAWLAGAGFTGMDFFGDYDLRMFVPASSPALVAVASISR